MDHEPFEFDDFEDLLDEEDDQKMELACDWTLNLSRSVGREVFSSLQVAKVLQIPVDYALQGAVDSLLRGAASLFQSSQQAGALPAELSFTEWAAEALVLTKHIPDTGGGPLQ